MTRLSSFWTIALLLLALLLSGAAIEGAIDFADAGQSLRLWVVYLAAHAFCYALVLSAPDDRPPRRRLLLAAGFSGAVLVGALVSGTAVGFLIAGSKMAELLTVVPLAILAATALAAALLLGAGLGYSLCIAIGERLWFPHLGPISRLLKKSPRAGPQG